MPTAELQAAPPVVAPKPLFAAEAADRALFQQKFDHQPFLFRHGLDQHPAFQLEALLALAERQAADPVKGKRSHFESGNPDRNAWFGARPEGETLVSALAAVKSGKNWIILKRVHEDRVYREVLEEIIPRISALSGVDVADTYYDPTMTIFVTSPGRVTPYHMDGETNFLAQIHGTKLVYLYDGNDPAVLSTTDLEKYWTGNLPKIDYPANLPFGHWQYRLEPGNGVFNPAIFPHWLENGDDVSISVSMNFKRRHDRTIGAHRTNHFLRRLGVKPTPPGQSPALDRAKEATFGRIYQAVYDLRNAMKAKS
jgi:hypothetical protein